MGGGSRTISKNWVKSLDHPFSLLHNRQLTPAVFRDPGSPGGGCLENRRILTRRFVSEQFISPTAFLEELFTDSVDEEVAFGPSNYDCYDPGLHTQILQEADLWELRSRWSLALSVGQQQRTALAACLSLRPRLLILDEPTLGQDWGHLHLNWGVNMRLSTRELATLAAEVRAFSPDCARSLPVRIGKWDWAILPLGAGVTLVLVLLP